MPILPCFGPIYHAPMFSRRRFLLAGFGAAMAAVLAACGAAIRSVVPSTSVAPTPSPSVPLTPAPTVTPAPSVAVTPLRTRIARLLLVGFRGLTPDEARPTLDDLAQRGLGGVVLFSVDQLSGGPRNVASPDQLRTLVEAIAAAGQVAPIVAIDQEGGLVARLGPDHGFAPTRSAASLGATGDPRVTRDAARAMAETLRSVGVTLNLAPVVDLAINPTNPIIAGVERSFSADPDAVIAHATAFIEAHREVGLRCAIKHFPGHGSASGDTHQGVVDVTDVWSEVELRPFEALVGPSLADAVLTAHVFNARLDPDHPATLSRTIVTGLLRERIGFDGPVLSDDLQMGAIRQVHGHDEAIALALEAGIDLLLIANQLVYEPDAVIRTVDVVERLVREGRIDEDRIDASVERVDRLRTVP